MSYVIRFEYPELDEQPLYAGTFNDTLGWSPTLDGALQFETKEEAGRMLANGYGASAAFGWVVEYALEKEIG